MLCGIGLSGLPWKPDGIHSSIGSHSRSGHHRTWPNRRANDRFVARDRGFIVRYDRIRAIEPTGAGTYQLLLDHPEEPKIPLARERAKKLRERIPFSG